MTRIGDFSNRASLHQPVSSNAESYTAFKLQHPALGQILGALERGANPDTRFLMSTRLAKMSLPARQKMMGKLQNLIGEIHRQIQLENDRPIASGQHHAPQNFQRRSEMSIEEIMRNYGHSMPNYQAPPSKSQQFPAPPSPFTAPPVPPTPASHSQPQSTSSPKSENTASASAHRTDLPRLSMRDRPDASHVKQLRANGMSDSDLMTLKDDIRGIRESDGSAKRQVDFDKKYAHMFDSSSDGGIRDNDKNYAILWMLITKDVRKTA